jgi:hypothetical protein
VFIKGELREPIGTESDVAPVIWAFYHEFYLSSAALHPLATKTHEKRKIVRQEEFNKRYNKLPLMQVIERMILSQPNSHKF